MSTPDLFAKLRERYTARFGPLIMTEAECPRPAPGDLPVDLGASGERGGLHSAGKGAGAREADEALERQIQRGRRQFAALDVRGVQVGSVDPPWNVERTAFPEPRPSDEDFAFWKLTFGPMTTADPRMVKASYGAHLRAKHEVFLAAAAPFYGFGDLLGDIVCHCAPLSPGMIVPAIVADTLFTAALLAPVEAGSIALGSSDGVERLALKVIPLTGPEAVLGGRSVERLIAALRAAGALELADPVRNCVISPEKTRAYWEEVRPALVSLMRDRQQLRQERLKRLILAGVDPLICGNERRLVQEARLLVGHLDPRTRMLH